MKALINDHDFNRIHGASMQILAETGMVFDSDPAVALFQQHGFKTAGKTVYFTEAAIMAAIAKVPNSFTLRARNPHHDLVLNMETSAIGTGRSAIFVADLDGKRRWATCEDYDNLAKLAQSLEAIQHWGPLVFPNDLPAANLPIYMTLSETKHLDKPYTVFNQASVDLVCLAFGISREKMQADMAAGIAYGHSTVNPTSPLLMIEEACGFLLDMAAAGIPLHISPSPAAGTTAPVTLPGTLVLQNCEILATLVLIQLVNPGLPVTYGTIACGVDMQTMAALYGSPEARLMEAGAAEIAKHYGLLSRGDVGFTEAMNADFQAGAESFFQFMNAVQNRINFLPGCGLLSSMLSASPEKLYLDAELAGYINRFARPLQFSDEDLAVELIQKVGSGGQYLTEEHTFRHFKEENYRPLVFSRMNYDNWEGEGRKSRLQAAREKVTGLLETYQLPDLDPGIGKDMADYAAKNWPVK